MAERKPIPKGVREQVLKEYRHLCAKCRGPGPQLHHIDEDASNSSDPMNLLPLCPNCHLRDQHSPTERMDPRRLSLFRKYKDPAILTSQFAPLFRRMVFLLEIDVCTPDWYAWETSFGQAGDDLLYFVKALNMGGYYWNQVGRQLQQVRNRLRKLEGGEKCDEDHLAALREARELAVKQIVELLRYQPWLEDERARVRSTGPR